ncbi:MAG: hypothetical protein JST70_11180 [Bacteroidetes bacterium]|uniref:Uncharacterized protein n=1 Tax=Parafilimonas terrae TaxID=1465490 RepID=A0A1I5TBW6_9BACT|nr:hypothetical protein [Parafilimonas terrae]MBS1779879.1 hypothetical protein [Bacteroidota bacterium]SFP80535.1 hypothetical protein SAMN05444277_10241 [Parafilimonas terrae]
MKEKLLQALLSNNQDVLKSIAMIIAHEVRNNIEDFHVAHLSDRQMKELNPLIREAIYNALFAIANYEQHPSLKNFIDFHVMSIPEYWEVPQLYNQFSDVFASLEENNTVSFKSQFLNEQFEIGNLYPIPKTNYIQIKASFDFIEVEGDKHKHRNKISSHLRREGYLFHPSIGAYILNSR